MLFCFHAHTCYTWCFINVLSYYSFVIMHALCTLECFLPVFEDQRSFNVFYTDSIKYYSILFYSMDLDAWYPAQDMLYDFSSSCFDNIFWAWHSRAQLSCFISFKISFLFVLSWISRNCGTVVSFMSASKGWTLV